MKKNVVITGLGFVTSIGNDKASVSDSLKNLKSGIEIFPSLAEDPRSPIKCAGTVKDFDTTSDDPEDWKYPSKYSVKREVLRGFAPHCLYAYCAMAQAIEDANLSLEEVSNKKTGIYTASAGSMTSLINNFKKMDKVGPMRCNPMAIVSSIVGTLSYNLVSAYKIKGSSCGFASACASSAHALGYAYDEVSSGKQNRMFVVGGEDGDKFTILPFAGMRALSVNPDPSCASRPFDKKRDGFVGTGGATVMVIEDEETAKARGAKIYARILGWGQASDGYSVAIPHPDGDGLATAIENCLEYTNTNADDIEYINTHATSTSIGDTAELRAMAKAFGGMPPKAAISSTKAITGHGLSLAGVMEAGFCALMLDEGFMTGSANITELDEAAVPFNIIRESKSAPLKKVMSLNSGFGGANTAILFEKP